MEAISSSLFLVIAMGCYLLLPTISTGTSQTQKTPKHAGESV